jgi:hypothetical protein
MQNHVFVKRMMSPSKSSSIRSLLVFWPIKNQLHFFSIILIILIKCSNPFPTQAQKAIFNINPSVLPGDALSVQGEFGAAAKVYLTSTIITTPQVLPILVQSEGHATVEIPSKLGLDIYQVWVEENGQHSPKAYVNQARGMHFDSPEVAPGGPLRIFGRNLLLGINLPQVRFIDRNSGAESIAIVDVGQSNSYTLRLTAPNTLQPGAVYDVYVSNKQSINAIETKVELPITAISAGIDYFNLGIGWAPKLNFFNNIYNVKTDSRLTLKAVGNGVNNDKPAIQEAIDKAADAGGGIVYLPEGTYKLLYSDWGGFYMKNRVVVQGAGKDKTFVKFGYDTPGYTAAAQAVHIKNGTYQSGFADLAMINVDNTGKWVSNLAGQGKELLLQRVRYDLNIGQWLILKGSDKVLIANSDIVQGVARTSGYRGPLLMDECTNFVLANNTFTYALDGLNMNMAHEGVFENNRVYRDGTARYPSTEHLINHVLILNFAQNVAVLNNLFKVTNGPAQDVNDGEAIIAEGGGPDRIDEDAGTVSGATATTLQDNSKNWGSFRLKPVVAIVNGKGMGQWRSIVSRNNNTLMLDRPWDVIPTAGAHYAIFNWGSFNWLLQNNIMEGNHRGITLYENAMTQVAIISNTLTNSGSIELSPYQTDNSGRGVPQEFLPMYTNQIVDNSVSNTNGSNGVFIGVHATQYVQQRTFGTSVIGLEIRNNILTAGKPNTPAVVDDSYPEGYLNFLNFQQMPGQYYIDEQIPAVLGTIFQNNKAINCQKAVYLNSGSYNTLVCNTQVTNIGNLLMDAPFEKLSHASVRTTSCLETAVASPPIADPKTNFPIPQGSGATRLVPLTGSSPIGTVVSFTISRLPTAAQGTLYVNNAPATQAASVPATQANMLSFQPNSAYTGEAAFAYSAVDQRGITSSTADFIVPVVNPLPVELIQFNAEAKGINTALAWITASEMNNDHFAIERSLDAINFTLIGIVRASGNTISKKSYSFIDTNPSISQSTIYYRIKQVDTDNQITYSPIRAVFFTNSQAVAIYIYPNPTTNALHVLLPTAGAFLSVYSTAGNLLMHARTSTAEASLDVAHLPAGIYPILIQVDKGRTIRQRFIKQ